MQNIDKYEGIKYINFSKMKRDSVNFPGWF
jgi:hypothetical protein